MSNVRRVSCRLLNICIVWTSLKTFHSRDMVLIACHNDRRLGSFSTKNTPMVFDTITNGIVYEPLDESDNYLNYSNFFHCLGFLARLDSFLLTHQS